MSNVSLPSRQSKSLCTMNPETGNKGNGAVALQKHARDSGKPYLTRKGNAVPGIKKPDITLKCKCQFKCKSLSYEQRLQLFRKYYETAPKIRGTYLMGLITISRIKRRRHGSYDDPVNSRRQATIRYGLPDGSGDIVPVCKMALLDTFGVGRKKLQTLINRKKDGENTFKDRRTRTSPRKFTERERNLVRNHINSIPRDESHYSRAKTAKEYLSPDLNCNRLYKAFLERHPETFVSYRFYSRILKEDFPNIAFRSPRTDTCRKCDLLNCEIKTRSERSQGAKQDLEQHIFPVFSPPMCFLQNTSGLQKFVPLV